MPRKKRKRMQYPPGSLIKMDWATIEAEERHFDYIHDLHEGFVEACRKLKNKRGNK